MGNLRARQGLFIAAYGDAAAANQDWNALQRLTADKVIEVDELVLLHREGDGKIHLQDTSRQGSGRDATLGLIFPPSLLATAAVGAGVAAGGAVVERMTRQRIKGEVEWALPLGGSGVVVLLDRAWAGDVEALLQTADLLVQHRLDDDDDDRVVTSQPVTVR